MVALANAYYGIFAIGRAQLQFDLYKTVIVHIEVKSECIILFPEFFMIFTHSYVLMYLFPCKHNTYIIMLVALY